MGMEVTGFSAHWFVSISVKLDSRRFDGSPGQHIHADCQIDTFSEREC